jgi:hypothetical protein
MKYVENNSRVIGIGCFIHRFNNLVKESFDSVDCFTECENVICEIINYFNYSPLRLSKLKEIQFELIGKEINLLSDTVTRWTSFSGSVRSYVNCYCCFKKYFLVNQDSSTKILNERIQGVDHIMIVLLIDKIFDFICYAFDIIQSSTINILDTMFQIENCIKKIKELKENIKNTLDDLYGNYYNIISSQKPTFNDEVIFETIQKFCSALDKSFCERFCFFLLDYVIKN